MNRLRLLAQTIGGPAEVVDKLRRAAVLADPRTLAARTEKVRLRGYADRMLTGFLRYAADLPPAPLELARRRLEVKRFPVPGRLAPPLAPSRLETWLQRAVCYAMCARSARR